MSKNARSALGSLEDNYRDQILRDWQEAQARLKIRWQGLLSAIEQKRQDTGTVPVSFLYERSRLATLLIDVQREVERLSGRGASVITGAQDQAVEISATDTERLLQTRSNAGSIVRLNPVAVNKLIGSTQLETPLADMLVRIGTGVKEQVKAALIDGVITGAGARSIASDLNKALGTGAAHALTIARTETNQAYREATQAHYQANAQELQIKGWKWIAALDLRTCVICWSRHGKMYALGFKPISHPNCRCTMVAVLPGSREIQTGEEKFLELTQAQKIAILGKPRFELYQAGLDLPGFVEYRKTKYGHTPVIKPLSDLPHIDVLRRRQPIRPPKPVVVPPAPPAPAPAAGIDKAKADLQRIHAKYADKLLAAQAERKAAHDAWWNVASSSTLRRESGLSIHDYSEQIIKPAKERRDLAAQALADLEREKRIETLDAVKPEKGLKLRYQVSGRTSKAEQTHLANGIKEFEGMVAEGLMADRDLIYVLKKRVRANHNFNVITVDRIENITTIIHETAHDLEQYTPQVLDNALRFYDKRTAGERPEKLSKLTGQRGYANYELAKRDQFFHAYDGKIPYTRAGQPYATEIISRGFEYMWQDAALFLEQQPDYFEMIWHSMRGLKWQE
jgi:SPP1 gp7 family putative phage head morphogenesis protein